MDHAWKNTYFQLYNQRGVDFPDFEVTRYIQYGNGFGRFCGFYSEGVTCGC